MKCWGLGQRMNTSSKHHALATSRFKISSEQNKWSCRFHTITQLMKLISVGSNITKSVTAPSIQRGKGCAVLLLLTWQGFWNPGNARVIWKPPSTFRGHSPAKLMARQELQSAKSASLKACSTEPTMEKPLECVTAAYANPWCRPGKSKAKSLQTGEALPEIQLYTRNKHDKQPSFFLKCLCSCFAAKTAWKCSHG